MGSLAGKNPANTYKSLLKTNNEAVGVSAIETRVEDGEGTQSAVLISDDTVRVTPVDDNTTGTFRVTNTGGDIYFKVDTTNKQVLVNVSQVDATTQLLKFSAHRIVPTAGTHYFVPCGGYPFQATIDELSNGTGANPGTTLDAGTSTDELVNMLFCVPFTSCLFLILMEADLQEVDLNQQQVNIVLKTFALQT